MVPNLRLFLTKVLQSDKLKGADFKNDNLFSNSSPQIPKTGMFNLKFRIFFFFFFFGKILEIGKFQAAGIKYDNSNLKFLAQKNLNEVLPAKKMPNKAFLVQNLDIVVFFGIFQI